MGNMRPFARAIERERVGTGHSLKLRRERLYRHRLNIQAEARAEHRKRSTAAQPKLAPGQKPGFFRSTFQKLRSIFHAKKSK